MKNHSKNRLKNSCRSCKIVSMSGGLELFAALITLILFIGAFFEPSRKTLIGKVLMGILLSHTLMQASDAFLWFLVDIPEHLVTVRILNIVSFAAGCAMLVLYVYCILLYISQKQPVSMKTAHFMAVLCFLASPLDAVWDITPCYLATTLSILMVYIVIYVSLSKRLLKKDQQHGHELHSGVQFTALLN